MKLTRERVLVIGASALLFVSLGLYLVLYKPLIADLKAESLELKRYQKKLTYARRAIDAFSSGAAERALIKEGDISLAIEELTKEIKSRKLELISMTPREIENGPDVKYKLLPIELKFKSEYRALGDFLGALDNMRKSLATVKSFRAGPSDDDPEKLNVELVTNIYLSGEDGE